jgi:hypothetical protein
MTASPANWPVILAVLLGSAIASAAAAQTQPQTEAQNKTGALPSITIGPAPSSQSPKIPAGPKTTAPAKPPSVSRPRTLQLRLDPKTGQLLTPEQLEERARRKIQPPRSLRARQPVKRAPVAAPAFPPADKAKAAAQSGVQGGGIQVKALGRAKVSAIGLLNTSQGGFGADMWAGTPLPLVMALLPHLPVAATSPVMQSLRRRLLLTTAMPPDERPDEQGETSAQNTDLNTDQNPAQGHVGRDLDGQALAAARIERLAAMGDSLAVTQLLKFFPLTMENKVYGRVRVDAALLNGNVPEACRMARNNLGVVARGEVIWQKIMAFCLAVEGQAAQVELYEQLLYENGVEDEAYFTLLSGLTSGESEPLATIFKTEPLHLAMLRSARRAIPGDALRGAAPAVVRAIATSPNASLTLRLEAAERAEAMGVLETDVLARVYASAPFSAEQSARAIDLAEQQPGPSAAAILYQVAQIDDQVSSRARALAASWRNGRTSGRYFTAVRVNLDLTRTIQPDARLAWFAADAGRALLAAGDRAAARAWLMAVIQPAREGQADAAVAMLSLAPLLYVSAKDDQDPHLGAVMETVMANWWQGEVANSGADRYQRAIRLFGLLSALGREVSSDLWLPLFAMPREDTGQASQGPVPVAAAFSAPPLLLGLERAARAGRRGETVLLALLLLGDGGPAAGDSLTLGRIVSALCQVGLEKDAGALALESLLGVGF